MHVLVLNHCSHNKGDCAVLYFVLRQLARCGADRITVSEVNTHWGPLDEDPQGINVRYIPYGWNVQIPLNAGTWIQRANRLRSAYYRRVSFPRLRRAIINDQRLSHTWLMANWRFTRALKRADIVISTGGHHQTSMFYPDNVGPLSFDVAMAVAAGKPVGLWSQSFGPFRFTDPINRQFTQRLMQRANVIYTRTDTGAQELQELGADLGQVRHTHESVFGLHDEAAPLVPAVQKDPILGIALYTQYKRTVQQREDYVNTFAALVDHAAAKGWRVHLFPHEKRGHAPAERAGLEAIVAAARHGDRCAIMPGDLPTPHHLEQVRRCRLFVGHKTHSVIFALTVATPVIAVSYHPKFGQFMKQFGLSELCVDDAELTPSRITSLFDSTLGRLDEIALQEQQAGRAIARRTREDFEQMMQILTQAARCRSGVRPAQPPSNLSSSG